MDLTIHFIFLLSVSYVHGFRNKDFCGKGTSNKMVKRIVGGNKADTSHWGWQVSFRKKDIETGEWFHICGGSIINDKWILSAAHCFDDDTPVGNYKVDSPHIPYYIFIERIFWPGNYNDKTLLHDIALIKLKKRLDFKHTNLYPICLPISKNWGPNLNYDCDRSSILSRLSDNCLDSYAGYATGWGRTSIKNKASSDLMEVKLKIHTLSDCKIIYNALYNAQYFNEDYMTCAGSNSKGICKGDSGGPLMIFKDNAWYQIGITSFSHWETCDITDGYTRVDAYMNWIDRTIEKYG